jgi:hypothetical protein
MSKNMAKGINKLDFYFGAILSVLLGGKHKQYTPSLISTDNKSGRIYEFTVNNEPDFLLIMTYASHPRKDTYDKDFDSWSLPFNNEQRQKIKEYMDSGKAIKIACMCGKIPLQESELALMDNEDIAQTIYRDGKVKKSVTIRRGKKKHNYLVFRGRSPKEAYQLKAQIPK